MSFAVFRAPELYTRLLEQFAGVPAPGLDDKLRTCPAAVALRVAASAWTKHVTDGREPTDSEDLRLERALRRAAVAYADAERAQRAAALRTGDRP